MTWESSAGDSDSLFPLQAWVTSARFTVQSGRKAVMAKTLDEKRYEANQRNAEHDKMSLEQRLDKLIRAGHGHCKEAQRIEAELSNTGKYVIGPERPSEKERLDGQTHTKPRKKRGKRQRSGR